MKQLKELPIIGWRECIALPDLGIATITAKIDTGARSSALHAFDVQRFDRDGKPMVRFKVHPFQQDSHSTISTEAELFDERKVRNSGGDAELRPVILTAVEILGSRSLIEVTLTNRDVMNCRMLLGRQAVRRRFLVNPGKSYLLSSKPRSTKQKRQKSQN